MKSKRVMILALVAGPLAFPQDDSKFGAEWGATVSGLLRFRHAAAKNDAKKLATLRDEVRKHLEALPGSAKTDDEKSFCDITSSRLDQVTKQMDETVRASEKGSAEDVDLAASKVTFILEEMADYLKAAGK